MKVFVLGASGMIGSAVLRQLEKAKLPCVPLGARSQKERWRLSGENLQLPEGTQDIGRGDFLVNCVGIVKSRITDATASTQESVFANTLLPIMLAKEVEKRGAFLINVSTDCVFSGADGSYVEDSPHDALDVYGKTKSLGEVVSRSVLQLRTSQVGPEPHPNSRLLLEWLRGLEAEAQIQGYVNHLWNGISSDAFGRIVCGIIRDNLFVEGIRHLVPSDVISKHDLVRSILDKVGRSDVEVLPSEEAAGIDRTLSTSYPTFNSEAFMSAGFESVPTVEETLSLMQLSELGL